MFPFGVLLVSMLIVTIFTVRSLTTMQKTLLENNLNSFSAQLVQTAEKNYQDIQNIATSVAYNLIIQDYLLETDMNSKHGMYTNVYSLLLNLSKLNNSILDIAAFGEGGNKLNIQGDIDSYSGLYARYRHDQTPIRFLKSNFTIGSREYNTQVAVMPIYQSTDMGATHIGTLFITLEPSVVITGSTDFDKKGITVDIILTDEDDSLIAGDMELYQELMTTADRSDSFVLRCNGVSYESQCFQIPSANSTLYTLVNKSEYTQDIIQIMVKQLAFLLCAFLITVIILFMFLKPLLSSMRQLTHIMDEIRSGKYKAMDERIPTDGELWCEEIASIATAFNGMLDETKRLNRAIFETYSRMYEMEMINRSTEIAFLRSQINPHFLYNTLTLICGLSAEGETDSVVEVTQALSQIFRYSIKGNDFVSVKEELDITKSYVMIQITRFEDRFTVDYDFTEEALNARIPKMIIQPLVENAIKHGIEKSLKKGTLHIAGRRDPESNTLILTIADTGVGIPADKLEQIRSSLKDSSNPPRMAAAGTAGDSIGINNVNSRIYLYYGQPYCLHIDSEEDSGTVMTITIPYSTA